jgi:hypothetical protein
MDEESAAYLEAYAATPPRQSAAHAAILREALLALREAYALPGGAWSECCTCGGPVEYVNGSYHNAPPAGIAGHLGKLQEEAEATGRRHALLMCDLEALWVEWGESLERQHPGSPSLAALRRHLEAHASTRRDLTC